MRLMAGEIQYPVEPILSFFFFLGGGGKQANSLFLV